jgi:hypothetical protein
MSLLPQQRTVALSRRAQLNEAPTEISTALDSPDTATGPLRSGWLPLPSWPRAPVPQHRMLWSPSSAHVCPVAAATAVAPVTPGTAKGVVRVSVPPLPIWP